MVLSFFPPSPQRTFLTIVVHGSSGYFLRFSIFVSLFWADSLFCFLDIVPTEVLFWQLLFILPVNTTLCIQQYFLCCAQIKTWSLSDIEKTFPCHQYFLSVSGLFVSKILTIHLIYQTRQLFFRGSVLTTFPVNLFPRISNSNGPGSIWTSNVVNTTGSSASAFQPMLIDFIFVSWSIHSNKIWYVMSFIMKTMNVGNLKNWQSPCILRAQTAFYELCFWFFLIILDLDHAQSRLVFCLSEACLYVTYKPNTLRQRLYQEFEMSNILSTLDKVGASMCGCDWNWHSSLLTWEGGKQDHLLSGEDGGSWEIWNPCCWPGPGQTRYIKVIECSKNYLQGGGYDYKQSFSGRVSQLVIMARALEADEVAQVRLTCFSILFRLIFYSFVCFCFACLDVFLEADEVA